jgi:nitrite reductase (NADH) small subunit
MAGRRVHVAGIGELLPGERKVIEADDLVIGVFNLDGEWFALEGVCPHQGGPLCDGALFRHLDAEVTPEGRIRRFFRSEEHNILACPWHGYEYDIRTGDCLVNPIYAVQTFPTLVEDGSVYVVVPDEEGSPDNRQSWSLTGGEAPADAV